MNLQLISRYCDENCLSILLDKGKTVVFGFENSRQLSKFLYIFGINKNNTLPIVKPFRKNVVKVSTSVFEILDDQSNPYNEEGSFDVDFLESYAFDDFVNCTPFGFDNDRNHYSIGVVLY